MLKQRVAYSLKCDKCKYEVIIVPQLEIGLRDLIFAQGFKIEFDGTERHYCPHCAQRIAKGITINP